ncbi:MAG: helix-turn-helix transcriptional regulator [Dermatophilaceae bacterium]
MSVEAQRPDFPSLLTVKDVASICGVPVSTVHHWAVRGEGPPSFKLGKHRRFDAAEVVWWLSAAKAARR